MSSIHPSVIETNKTISKMVELSENFLKLPNPRFGVSVLGFFCEIYTSALIQKTKFVHK